MWILQRFEEFGLGGGRRDGDGQHEDTQNFRVLDNTVARLAIAPSR